MNDDLNHEYFMNKAIKESKKAIDKNLGGPFGAVIIKDDKIIAKAHNTVLKKHDPTNHAEMNVIRKASRKLKRFDLSDCILYTSCEPCPMCFSAIHWAKIKQVYYACTKEDAHNIGFDDKFIYDILEKKIDDNTKFENVGRDFAIKIFNSWKNKEYKIQY